MRFYPINSGDILLDGQSIYDYTRASLRQQFGMVLQETWLKQGTIHDNIAFGNPDASREQVIAAAKAANADFFIQQLPQGYDTKLENAGESLSVGQAQLLTIARVFLARYTDRGASTGCLCQTHEGAHKLYHCSPFVNYSGCGFDSCLGRW